MMVQRAADERCAQRRVQARPHGAGEVSVAGFETSTSCSLTSQNTNATKLRPAVSAVAVLKVGTSNTRRASRSMCTCKNSWLERATGSCGSSRTSRLIIAADAPIAMRGDGQRIQKAGRWSALTC